ncbi:hypothetical protein N0V90_001302 [Kalmusia sp. IMI 367209]|nr:hypothetical protein N0V90_001302 [Kalmusia sp. IMI 367209]
MADLDPATLFGVNGLIAVITGGGTGIGLMLAQALEANGATVYILGRRLDVLEKAAGTAKHGKIHPIRADATSKKDLSAAVGKIENDIGYINLLIANHGINGPVVPSLQKSAPLSEFREKLWAIDTSDFTQTYAVNNGGVFFAIVAFLDLLDKGNKKRNVVQKSQVIATSSIGAFNRVPLNGGYAYGGSKAGVVHLMKQFASTLVEYGIRSNVIAPGFYPSEMTQPMLDRGLKFTRDLVPEERAGDVQDMAGAVLFLVSRAGAYINGNVLLTDGGRLSVLPATY